MATQTTKLAGPDQDGFYKVLAVKGHLKVRPGDVYTEDHVRNVLLRNPHVETTVIEPKWPAKTRLTEQKFLTRFTEAVA